MEKGGIRSRRKWRGSSFDQLHGHSVALALALALALASALGMCIAWSS